MATRIGREKCLVVHLVEFGSARQVDVRHDLRARRYGDSVQEAVDRPPLHRDLRWRQSRRWREDTGQHDMRLLWRWRRRHLSHVLVLVGVVLRVVVLVTAGLCCG